MERAKSRAPKTRLYYEQDLQQGHSVLLQGDMAHYVQHVLRAQSGDSIALFNPHDGEWSATLTALHKKQVEVRIGDRLSHPRSTPDVWVCFAPIKFAKIDFLAQKVTELGAARLQPVMTQYTQVERVNTERLRANAMEAAQQCGRCDIPVIAPPVNLRQLLAEWPQTRPLFYGDETGQGTQPCALLADVSATAWGVLVGPEGGFAPEELAVLRQLAYAHAVSLGPRILRADTAALTLLAVTQCWLGDWSHKPGFA